MSFNFFMLIPISAPRRFPVPDTGMSTKIEHDLDYYRRRQSEEGVRAEQSGDAAARLVHARLAELYGERVEVLGGKIAAAT